MRLAPLGLAFALLAPLPLAAQAPDVSAPPSPAIATKENDISAHKTQLQGVEDTISASDAQRQKIEAEVENLRGDRARLSAALIETTQQIQDNETRVSDAEARLASLKGREDAIRRSLASRRDVIAEVLASLQRMGRTPPPALLVSPEDMLQAIRTSMLLGSVVPQMRAETAALASDLSALVHLREAVATEKTQLAQRNAELELQRQTLAALVSARQASLGVAEQALDAEQQRAADLAQQATSMKQLIARMEEDLAGAKKAAEEAAKAEAARKLAEAAAPPVQKTIISPFKDPGRLAPAMAFADTKGLLPLPAAGSILRSYGAPDGVGGTEKGMLMATRRGAIVAAPYDGWVAFSGPYRSFGQVLIINAGGGYYMVLAGMKRINVEAGQFVLAGEPVANMGDGLVKTAAAMAIGAAEPILYVEFRKDGAAIDPGPWWARPDMQRVRG
ncbi:MAG: peptidoglycan DD-metalloendopeptidase family protein [Xanthobacteraceae bacterium]|nr:peptidoglycan DD-metalloendopeptidase family protein [Xanthobacteraceae bacterium]